MHDHQLETAPHAEHAPLYSWAPLIIGVGVFIMNAGFVFGIAIGALGVLVLLAGVIVWIRQDVRLWAQGSDEHGDH